MRQHITQICAAAPLFIALSTMLAQTIPPVQTRTLDGLPVVLPGNGRTKPILLLLGFSHRSDDDFKKWTELAHPPFASDSRIDYYELVDLQGVPSLINKMILHGMRRAVPEPRKSHFAPFYQHEAEWKELVHYSDPNVAYIVLADPRGHVEWQTRGPATETKAGELASILAKISEPGR